LRCNSRFRNIGLCGTRLPTRVLRFGKKIDFKASFAYSCSFVANHVEVSTSVLLANFSPSMEQHSSLKSRMHQGFVPTRQALYPVGIHLGDDDCPFRSARVFGNFANHKRQYDPQGDMVLPGIRKTRHGIDHEPLACVYKVAPKTSPRCTVRIHSFFSSGLRRCAFFESHPRPRLRRLDLLVFDCLLSCGHPFVQPVCFRNDRGQHPTSPRFHRGSKRSLVLNTSRRSQFYPCCISSGSEYLTLTEPFFTGESRRSYLGPRQGSEGVSATLDLR